MANTTQSVKLLEKYILNVCKCDIGNSGGKNNIKINVADMLVYLTYLAITIETLWVEGITTLPFIATMLLIIRSLFKEYRKTQNIQKGGARISPTSQNRSLIYGCSLVFIFILYFATGDEYIGKLLLTICYAIFAAFELTDVLLDCYEATPRVYQL